MSCLFVVHRGEVVVWFVDDGAVVIAGRWTLRLQTGGRARCQASVNDLCWNLR